jgi:hypothetical protein
VSVILFQRKSIGQSWRPTVGLPWGVRIGGSSDSLGRSSATQAQPGPAPPWCRPLPGAPRPGRGPGTRYVVPPHSVRISKFTESEPLQVVHHICEMHRGIRIAAAWLLQSGLQSHARGRELNSEGVPPGFSGEAHPAIVLKMRTSKPAGCRAALLSARRPPSQSPVPRPSTGR